MPIKSDLIPCSDASGEIVQVGSQVPSHKFKLGDHVISTFYRNFYDGSPPPSIIEDSLGAKIDGVLAQYVAFKYDDLVKISPGFLTHEEASTIPCAGVTAWSALYGSAKVLIPGSWVLVQGTGGVSLLGAQIAAAAGANVIVTSSSDEKLQQVKKLIPQAHTINYSTTPEWSTQVKVITGNRGVDQLFNVAGDNTLPESFKSTAFSGYIYSIGAVGGAMAGKEEKEVAVTVPSIFRNVTISPVLVGSRRQAEDLVRAVEKMKVRPVVGKVFKWEEAKEAMKYLQKGAHFGKVVIQVAQ